jgi:hypothetical protein
MKHSKPLPTSVEQLKNAFLLAPQALVQPV